jgi:hypothetical protein
LYAGYDSNLAYGIQNQETNQETILDFQKLNKTLLSSLSKNKVGGNIGMACAIIQAQKKVNIMPGCKVQVQN